MSAWNVFACCISGLTLFMGLTHCRHMVLHVSGFCLPMPFACIVLNCLLMESTSLTRSLMIWNNVLEMGVTSKL